MKLTLTDGLSFQRLVPDDAEEIIFTDQKAPEGVKVIDLSYDDECNGCVGWYTDDKKYFVSSQIEGVKISAHENCDLMFAYKSELVNIDFSNLDTSDMETARKMFLGDSKIEVLNLSFDTTRTYDMTDIFAGCKSLKAVDISTFDFREARDHEEAIWKDWCEENNWKEKNVSLKPKKLSRIFGGPEPFMATVRIDQSDSLLYNELRDNYIPKEHIKPVAVKKERKPKPNIAFDRYKRDSSKSRMERMAQKNIESKDNRKGKNVQIKNIVEL